MATRWATDDLSGRVIEKYDRAKSLIFPAIDDKDNPLISELHPLDDQTRDNYIDKTEISGIRRDEVGWSGIESFKSVEKISPSIRA